MTFVAGHTHIKWYAGKHMQYWMLLKLSPQFILISSDSLYSTIYTMIPLLFYFPYKSLNRIYPIYFTSSSEKLLLQFHWLQFI